MMRTVLKLLIAFLVIRAGWHAVPTYWKYRQFKSAVQEVAQFADDRSPAAVGSRVMEVAEELEVPLAREAVTVRNERDHVYIDATYTEQLEIVPRVFRSWTFVITVDARMIRPTGVRELAPQ